MKHLDVEAAASRIARVIREHSPGGDHCNAAAVLLSPEVEAVVTEVADRFRNPLKTARAFRLALDLVALDKPKRRRTRR